MMDFVWGLFWTEVFCLRYASLRDVERSGDKYVEDVVYCRRPMMRLEFVFIGCLDVLLRAS